MVAGAGTERNMEERAVVDRDAAIGGDGEYLRRGGVGTAVARRQDQPRGTLDGLVAQNPGRIGSWRHQGADAPAGVLADSVDAVVRKVIDGDRLGV